MAARLLLSGSICLLSGPVLAQGQPSSTGPAPAPSALPAPAPSSVAPPAPTVPEAADPLAVPPPAPTEPAGAAPTLGPSEPLPGFPDSGPLTGVVDNPNRVFGDDALDPVGLDLLGSVIGGFGFSMNASVQAEYNSNFARIADGAPLPARFNSKDEWRITPNASAQISRPLGRQRLFATGTIGYDFYLRNEGFDQARLGINGGLQWRLGTRCSGLFYGGWNQRAFRASDFATFAAGNQESSNYGVTGGCSLASGLGFNAGVRRNFLRNDTEFREFADLDATSINGSIFYSIGRRGSVFVSGSSSFSEFPNQLLPDGSTNSTDINSLSVGMSYRFGTSLRASAQIGQSWIRPGNPISEDSSGGIWSLGLSYSGTKIGANLSLSRNFSALQSGFVGGQRVTSFLASVSYRANNRLSFAAGYNRTEQDLNIVESGTVGPQPRPNFADDRLFAGADFTINRLLSLSADVNHVKRTADNAAFDFSSTRAGLTLRARI